MQNEAQPKFTQMNLISNLSFLNSIQELTRLQFIGPKTRLLKQKKVNIQNIKACNLQSCIEFFIQINYLTMACIRKSFGLIFAKNLYIQKSNGNVYGFFQIFQTKEEAKKQDVQKHSQKKTFQSQSENQKQVKSLYFLQKYGKQLKIFTISPNAKMLYSLNAFFYERLIQVFQTVGNQKVKQAYLQLMNRISMNQNQIQKGTIRVQDICQWLQNSPLFRQFSMNLRIKNTLIGLNINSNLKKVKVHKSSGKSMQKGDLNDYDRLLQTFQQFGRAQSNQIQFITFIADFRNSMNNLLMILSSFSLLSTQNTMNSADTSMQESSDNAQSFQKYCINEKQIDLFRKKLTNSSIANFTLKINQKLFQTKISKQKTFDKDIGVDSIFQLNLYDLQQKGQIEESQSKSMYRHLLYAIQLKIQAYMYKIQSKMYLSILLKIPIKFSSLQALYFEKIWQQLTNYEPFNAYIKFLKFFEDPYSKQHFLHQKLRLEKLDKRQILEQIIFRTDELVIFYLGIQPIFKYFHIYGKSSMGAFISQQKINQEYQKSCANQMELQKIACKIGKALKLYNNIMNDKQFNLFKLAPKRIYSLFGYC